MHARTRIQRSGAKILWPGAQEAPTMCPAAPATAAHAWPIAVNRTQKARLGHLSTCHESAVQVQIVSRQAAVHRQSQPSLQTHKGGSMDARNRHLQVMSAKQQSSSAAQDTARSKSGWGRAHIHCANSSYTTPKHARPYAGPLHAHTIGKQANKAACEGHGTADPAPDSCSSSG